MKIKFNDCSRVKMVLNREFNADTGEHLAKHYGQQVAEKHRQGTVLHDEGCHQSVSSDSAHDYLKGIFGDVSYRKRSGKIIRF